MSQVSSDARKSDKKMLLQMFDKNGEKEIGDREIALTSLLLLSLFQVSKIPCDTTGSHEEQYRSREEEDTRLEVVQNEWHRKTRVVGTEESHLKSVGGGHSS